MVVGLVLADERRGRGKVRRLLVHVQGRLDDVDKRRKVLGVESVASHDDSYRRNKHVVETLVAQNVAEKLSNLRGGGRRGVSGHAVGHNGV